MCLHRLDKVIEMKNHKIVNGYQVKDTLGMPKGQYKGLCYTNPVLYMGVWCEQNDLAYREHAETILPPLYDHLYLAGFHIHTNKKDMHTQDWAEVPGRRLLKVKGRCLLAIGKNTRGDFGRTLVVKDLMLIEDLGPYKRKYSEVKVL